MFDWPAIYADFKASGYTCIRKYYLESRRIHTSLHLSEAEFLNLP